MRRTIRLAIRAIAMDSEQLMTQSPSSPPIDPNRDVPVPIAPSKPLVKVFVGLLLILVIGGGAVMWVMTHRGGPARDLSEKFIREVSSGNFEAAKALCTDDVDFGKLKRTADTIPDNWGEIVNLSLPASTTRTIGGETRTDIAGLIEYEKLRKSFSASVIELPDGTYRIKAYSFE
jgi:hypothetical protein